MIRLESNVYNPVLCYFYNSKLRNFVMGRIWKFTIAMGFEGGGKSDVSKFTSEIDFANIV